MNSTDSIASTISYGAPRDRVGEVAGDALADRLRLADVDDPPLRVAEQVDAGTVGQVSALLGQAGAAALGCRRGGHACPSSRIRSHGQPLLGHPDAAHPGDARGDGARRGGRRAAPRRPDRARARGARGRAARARGGACSCPRGRCATRSPSALHIRPGGDEMFLGRDTHPLRSEAGGPAVLSGAVMTGRRRRGGHVLGRGARRRDPRAPADDRYAPRPRLVCVEQPTNMGGGRVWPAARLRGGARGRRARTACATHLDGARLLNATVAAGRRRRRRGRALRHRVDRLHEGARRAGRARAWPARAR